MNGAFQDKSTLLSMTFLVSHFTTVIIIITRPSRRKISSAIYYTANLISVTGCGKSVGVDWLHNLTELRIKDPDTAPI
jgi:hypothetical protein